MDLTLLLKRNDYEQLILDVPMEKNFLFANVLDEIDEKRLFIESLSKKGLSLKYLSNDTITLEDTLEKWLANFRNAILL